MFSVFDGFTCYKQSMLSESLVTSLICSIRPRDTVWQCVTFDLCGLEYRGHSLSDGLVCRA